MKGINLGTYGFARRAIEATLKWCNDIRELNHQDKLDELPKGIRQNGESCPCGEATNLFVGGISFRKRLSKCGFTVEPYYPLPDDVKTFVELFDNGFLPEFDVDELRSAGLPVNQNNDINYY